MSGKHVFCLFERDQSGNAIDSYEYLDWDVFIHILCWFNKFQFNTKSFTFFLSLSLLLLPSIISSCFVNVVYSKFQFQYDDFKLKQKKSLHSNMVFLSFLRKKTNANNWSEKQNKKKRRKKNPNQKHKKKEKYLNKCADSLPMQTQTNFICFIYACVYISKSKITSCCRLLFGLKYENNINHNHHTYTVHT